MEKLKSMKCFLQYYNNKDVSHFIQGIKKQQEFWKEQKICMISDAVSLSGLSLKLFDKHIPCDVYFGLPQKNEENFIRYLRLSICGVFITSVSQNARLMSDKDSDNLCRSW